MIGFHFILGFRIPSIDNFGRENQAQFPFETSNNSLKKEII
jgi:hypothetical protein